MVKIAAVPEAKLIMAHAGGQPFARGDWNRAIMAAQHTEPEATGADAIAAAAHQIAGTLDLSTIICWTGSGSTGLRVSRERPQAAIVAISPNVTTGRKLSVAWGIHSVVAEDAHDQDDMVERACRLAFQDGFAKAGRRVVIVGGGFGGLSAAKALAGKPVDVTLIDRNNHHLFQPLLYQVATAGLSPAGASAWTRTRMISWPEGTCRSTATGSRATGSRTGGTSMPSWERGGTQT